MQKGAQVYVSRGASASAPEPTEPAHLDLVVGERADGEAMTPDTLNLWLSATKPVTAVAFALLWQRGLCDLDDRVAHYLPDFGTRGKEEITLRQILTHTSGIRMLSVGWPEASWDEILERICSSKLEPGWTPGETAGYHMASSWFVLGAVIQELAGEPFARFVRREVMEPLGMEDSWIGMPRERFEAYGDRLGRMWSTERASGEEGNGERKAMLRNWHRERHVVPSSPGGNGWGPIRELGRFYEMLLRHGRTAAGDALLTPQTVEALTTPQRVGLRDKTFRRKLDWGLGFIVDSKHYADPEKRSGADDDLIPYGYGRHASRRAFGHSGFQSSVALADPVHDLVLAIFVNGNPGEPRHTERMRALCEAAYEDLGLVGG